MDESQEELPPNTFVHPESAILKTLVTACQPSGHVWRKLNAIEIACTICPTINIVSNADDYIK